MDAMMAAAAEYGLRDPRDLPVFLPDSCPKRFSRASGMEPGGGQPKSATGPSLIGLPTRSLVRSWTLTGRCSGA